MPQDFTDFHLGRVMEVRDITLRCTTVADCGNKAIIRREPKDGAPILYCGVHAYRCTTAIRDSNIQRPGTELIKLTSGDLLITADPRLRVELRRARDPRPDYPYYVSKSDLDDGEILEYHVCNGWDWIYLGDDGHAITDDADWPDDADGPIARGLIWYNNTNYRLADDLIDQGYQIWYGYDPALVAENYERAARDAASTFGDDALLLLKIAEWGISPHGMAFDFATPTVHNHIHVVIDGKGRVLESRTDK